VRTHGNTTVASDNRDDYILGFTEVSDDFCDKCRSTNDIKGRNAEKSVICDVRIN